ncbi:MAG: hypothetical protein ACO3C1_04150 [Ilumatobacteraceae bacterium]
MTTTEHPSTGGETAPTLALRLARWFEARLHDTVVAHSSQLRLYALAVLDPDELDVLGPRAVRVQFVAEAPTLDRLRAAPGLEAARQGDAVAFVSTQWMVPSGHRPSRPGDLLRRRRARVVQVVTDHGAAAVARYDDAPDIVVLSTAA